MKVAERIHQIPTPTPFYVGAINTYLIEDEPLTLVDSGLKTEEAEEALRAGLNELGFGFGDIEQLVITHAHLDHYGLMGKIAAEGAPRVLAHPLETYDIESEHGYAASNDPVYERTERFLLRSGLPEESLETILIRHPIFQQLREAIKVTHLIEDGDILKLKHTEWNVIHCPGHSKGMINLYDPTTKVLLSGDNILSHISPVPLLHFPRDPSMPRVNSLAEYIATLGRLKTFDIDLVLGGHGDIIPDIRKVIDSIIVHHEVRKRKVFKFVRGSAKTAFDICSHLFPDIDPYQVYLGMSEAVGHLDILESEGLVEMEERDETYYYRSKTAP